MDCLLVGDSGGSASRTTHMGAVYGRYLRAGHSKCLVRAEALLAGDLCDENTELLCGMHNQWLGRVHVWKRIFALPDTEYGGVWSEPRRCAGVFRAVLGVGIILHDVSGKVFQANELRHRLRGM